MSGLKVSIVMATYNGAPFLKLQLQSLKAQTLKPYEIVVNDDKSSDDTCAIVADFAASTDIPVRLVQNERGLGFADNFLTAAARATGDLIAFCDQDDVWHPEKLERVVKAFDDPELVMCTHRANLIDAAGQHIGVLQSGNDHLRLYPVRDLTPFKCYYGFSITLRRSLVSVIPYTKRGVDYMSGDARLSHDRWVTFLASQFGKVLEMPDILVDYRQHGRNVFGANYKPPLQTSAQQRESRLRYSRSTKEFLALLDHVDPEVVAQFPAYDARKSRELLSQLMRQESQRARVYEARGPLSALLRLIGNLTNGTYNGFKGAVPRPGPVARDLYFSLFKSAFCVLAVVLAGEDLSVFLG